MGYLGLFIHSGLGDGSVGSVMEATDQEMLIFTIVDHLAQLYPLSRHHIFYNLNLYTTSARLLSSVIYHLMLSYIPSVCVVYMLIYANLLIIYAICDMYIYIEI